jgi:hypothetical protein
MPVTEQDVLDVLRSSPRALKAKEIAANLTHKKGERITRTEVNRLLYNDMKPRRLVARGDGDTWQVRTEPRPDSTSQGNGPSRATSGRPTFYDILEVLPTAHARVIEKAYKALVGLYHPDRASPETRKEFEEKMKNINVAYETLSDEQKRRRYDDTLRRQKH